MKCRPSRGFVLAAALMCALPFCQNAIAAPTTPTAASIIADAEAKAANENKNVFVIFHASWCEWCHRLDDFLAMPEVAPIMDANYVTVHIDLEESDDKKDLDNPGGDELLDKLGGKGQGIPYYAILSPTNQTLAVSKDAKGNNLGYPGGAHVFPVFMKMLQTTSHLSDSDADLFSKNMAEAGAKIKAQNEARMKLLKPIEDAMNSHDYKTALSDCEGLITSHPELAGGYLCYLGYQALLYVDEDKALSEFGKPVGDVEANDADIVRAQVIISQDSLSDRAYNKALPIFLASETKAPVTWYSDIQIALAYSRVHQTKKAIEYQDKAIEGAKAAQASQKFIDGLVKAEQDWKNKG